ncbi:NAD(P)H-quinone oxidoreductase [Fodinibius sediminis]|uniref:Putative NAD(P)H quinone oxidoreductase, PIG3 family n=1 Tax=Fodinibius sediminis TaxID=1214077 RepID=A0A521D516_9BACT|nr:NAD(P)H-quinone oxidoreductase [Fodinibius sediminis]SMO66769.1 putative NAD(P)H quinone oxidoreductase, PIG3 family [Fodinibius sediminis]
MKAILIQNPGKNSSLCIEERSRPEPNGSEILVRIRATAVNRADLLQRSGNYPPPEGASDIPGLEMGGVVEEVGAHVTKWKKGDRVFGLLPGGGYAQYCTLHESLAMAVPSQMSFAEAAAIPETFLTAFQALYWLANVQEKETVLIHAGGSGVGTAAIQLCRHLSDAHIITTAGQEYKLKTAKKLGADLAYNYKTRDYAEEITRELGSAPVDVIVDFIGKPYWHKNMEILAMDGRVVYLSFLGGHAVEDMSLIPILRKRLSIMGSTLRNRPERYKIALVRAFTVQALSLFDAGILQPVIDSTFDWHHAEKAHQRMRENKNTGKIVLEVM